MKKIMAIGAMAAMVAGAAFAADVQATVKSTGSAFDWNSGKDAKPTAVTVNDINKTGEWGTRLNLEAKGEKAGASLKIYTGAENIQNASIWLKPVDQFKLTLGSIDSGLFNDYVVDYKNGAVGGYGAKSTFTFGMFSADIDIAADAADKPAYDGATNTLGLVNGKVTLDIDGVGKIAALVSNKATPAGGEIKFRGTPLSHGYKDQLKLGLGYDGTFGDVSVMTNVFYSMNFHDDKDLQKGVSYFDKLDSVVSVQYKKDTFRVAGYVTPAVITGLAANKDSEDLKGAELKTEEFVDLGFAVYCEYGFDNGLTPSLKVSSGDVIAETVDVVVTPKLAGKCGAADWNIAVKNTFSNGSVAYKVAVPFEVSLGL